jgi:hypothetical protein
MRGIAAKVGRHVEASRQDMRSIRRCELRAVDVLPVEDERRQAAVNHAIQARRLGAIEQRAFSVGSV